METEYIIILKFNTKAEGLTYMSNSTYKFAFTNGSNIYNYSGSIITIGDHEVYNYGDIALIISDKNIPGSLYVENGFLKYYKEL